MSFIETRLLDCVAYGTQCGPTWNTRRVGLKSGVVRRNPRRSRPIYVATLLYQHLLPQHYREVIAAFNACMGGVYAFRLKDWSDFQADDELLPVLGTGAAQTVQLVKSYTFGTQTVQREIRKPVSGTVVITANDTPIAATVDYTTGQASFTAANGTVLRWSGEFDVPMMFSDDALPFRADSRSGGDLVMTADATLEEDLSAGEVVST
jgi:uncharacterized protein (TIGR02217 family)